MFLKLEKKFISLPNGETIAYIEKGSGDKVIVLVHGNFSSCYHYEPLYKRIPDDYRVIAMDLRGYGDSSYNTPLNTLHDASDDIASLLRLLNVEKAVVIGWSLGGCVSMSLAARYPSLVEKLILVGSGSAKGFPVFKKSPTGESLVGQIYSSREELATDPINVAPMLLCQKTQNFKLMESIWNLTIYTSESKKHPTDEENEVLINETLKQRNLVDADWALMNFNISDQTSFYSAGENIAKNIICSILAINGKQDITVSEVMTSENRQALNNLVQIYYDDCGHSVINDQPDLLLKDILSFINC